MNVRIFWLTMLAFAYSFGASALGSDNLLIISKVTGVVRQPAPRPAPAPNPRPAFVNPPAGNNRPAPRTPPIVAARPPAFNPPAASPGPAPRNPPASVFPPAQRKTQAGPQTARPGIVSLPTVNSIVKNGIRDPTDQKVIVKDIRKKSDWPQVVKPLEDLQRKYGIKPDRFKSWSSDPDSAFKRRAVQIAAKRHRKGHDFLLDTMELESEGFLDAGFADSEIQYAVAAVDGPDPTQFAGYILGVAISAAQDYYSAVAKPIPDDIKQALAMSFPNGAQLLDVARYAVGDVQIALPTYGPVGRRQYLGDDFAVVLGDIIVFKQDPVAAEYPVQLWGNELKHVADYESLKGVDLYEYAFAYLSENSTLPDTPPGQTSAPSDDSTFTLSDGEFYAVQCVFRWAPELAPYSVQYLITNTGKVVASDPTAHESIQIGTVSLPETQSDAYVWKFATPQGLVFEVLKHGELVEIIPTGTDQTGATVTNILRLVGHIKGVDAIPASMK
jgi:hypothetical protein